MAAPKALPPFPSTRLGGVSLPSTPLVKAAYSYIHLHTSPAISNHTIRSAFFSLILREKLTQFSAVDPETVVVATLLHDLGWSFTSELVSQEKRFEVDGANVARDFVRTHFRSQTQNSDKEKWDEEHLDRLWYAIALHTTPSLALHAPALTALTELAISADFSGPNVQFHGAGNARVQLITPAEFKEILHTYPRLGFKEKLREIICGLCRNKPQATFDDFAADFGKRLVPGYIEKLEDASVMKRLEGGLDATVQFE
ncbi:hypothetical protein EPUS_07981 [Endocarpon pusillum Z07020]|uniref:HD domain-containing protein n=1 Tax=Endocarpon pusillum (strain Z07020 / HMAS-L-300199) TaxID=1263415 RepID=U1HJY9_ENDPU|nr:uncharacterized protein EPUS_07981 [Endocarpon pusillum Z07020]ERF70560.1 hypothetical protein EPUS_07981 [Endocarpon pusillum Z07020]